MRPFISNIDPDAADTFPGDYIPTRRLRAEEAYEVGTPERTTGDELSNEWAELLRRSSREADRLLYNTPPTRKRRAS